MQKWRETVMESNNKMVYTLAYSLKHFQVILKINEKFTLIQRNINGPLDLVLGYSVSIRLTRCWLKWRMAIHISVTLINIITNTIPNRVCLQRRWFVFLFCFWFESIFIIMITEIDWTWKVICEDIDCLARYITKFNGSSRTHTWYTFRDSNQ